MKYIRITLYFLFFLNPQVSYSNNAIVADPSVNTDLEASYQNMPIESMYALMIAEIAFDRKDYSLALKTYLKVANETQNPAIAQRATEISTLLMDIKSAIKPAQIWADNAPDDLSAQATTAAILITQNMVMQSVPYLKRIAIVDPQDAADHFQLLYDELGQEKLRDDLITALETLRQEDPSLYPVYLSLTNIYLLREDTDKAMAISTEAIDKHDMNKDSIMILHAEALRYKGQLNNARTFVELKLKQLPQSHELRLYYADVLSNLYQDAPGAQHELNLLLKVKELSDDVALNGAYLSLDQGWTDLTKQFIEQLKTSPEQLDVAYFFSAKISELENDIPAAIESYKRVPAGPLQMTALTQAASLSSKLGDYTESLKMLEMTSPETVAEFKLVVLLKIDALTKLNKDEEAMDVLTQAIDIIPQELDLLYVRALLADKIGDVEVAEADLRAIIHLKPTHVDALNALGYILADKTPRHAEALVFIERAYALEPDNAGVLDSLGWVYYKLGRVDEAEAILAKAYVTLKDGLVAAHYGEVLWAQGKEKEATLVWMDTLKSIPQDQHLAKVVSKYIPDHAKK